MIILNYYQNSTINKNIIYIQRTNHFFQKFLSFISHFSALFHIFSALFHIILLHY
jgi:hypothetical protein